MLTLSRGTSVVTVRKPRAVAAAAAVLLASLLLTACSSGPPDPATKGDIRISRTDVAVVIENRAGRPTLNIRATVDAGEAGLFFTVVPTIETAETRTIRFAAFRTEDGTLLDPATVTPKEIKVTAKDTLNNDYEVTIPWDRGR